METWTDTSIIGDVFLTMAPYFKSYTQYCNNYPACISFYNRKKTSNPKFAKFLEVDFHFFVFFCFVIKMNFFFQFLVDESSN